MPVLLVDGDNLLTIGFYGLKNYFYKGKHIGAIYHFINTLRKAFDLYHLDKICVFWDGENSAMQRKRIYPHYKEGRKSREKTEEEINNYNYQRTRVKRYLEELYVRQGEFPNCETDDCIAFYTQQSPKEKIIIYSSDRDLAQLVNENVSLFNPSHGILYSPGDIIEYDHEQILIENVKIVKMLCGDSSDSIYGIRGFGIKHLLELYPEIKTTPITLQQVRDKGNLIFEQNKDSKLVKNLLTGVTKLGVFGDEFFTINEMLIDLKEPLLDEWSKRDIIDLINEKLDTEGRSYKNTMKMMIEDGIFTVLPKRDDAWINFLNPFLRLTRIEKNKHLTYRK